MSEEKKTAGQEGQSGFPGPPDYQLIRTNRKSIAIQISRDGSVVVRAPLRCPVRKIEEFLRQKQGWIRQQQQKLYAQTRLRERQELTPGEREEKIQEARKIFPGKVAFYAEKMGVTYGRITIREQKTRWGSCSSKGNLNFNWKLIRMPEEIRDYVVVHELAHRKEMNHSRQFYQTVASVLPDYRQRERWLKEHGGEY